MDLIRPLLFGGIVGNKVNIDVALLLLRFFVGLAFMTIFEKFLPRDGLWGPQPWFVSDVAELGFPMPVFFAWAAVLSEFFGGLLMMLGFMTRPAAFLNCIVTGVAAFLQHQGDVGQSGLAAFAFLLMCSVVLVAGPGFFSIDAFIAKRHQRTHSLPTVQAEH